MHTNGEPSIRMGDKTMTFGKLMTKAEAARILRISVATLDRRIADGSIAYYKQGWQVFFSEQHIEDYMARCEKRSQTLQSQKNGTRVASSSIS
jgi:excisionase family DNA binding protein